MRLSSRKLFEITGFQRKSAQAKWFKDYLGIDVPCDRIGPILTNDAYEALVKKRLGVLGESMTPGFQDKTPRVKLLARAQ